ncbi:MAG: hypothetical protein IPO99_12715 [Nitrospira sp.]|nr:hypothetical protein [Nitrospira sp.]
MKAKVKAKKDAARAKAAEARSVVDDAHLRGRRDEERRDGGDAEPRSAGWLRAG